MKNLNITKMDSKGRILIPIHIRSFLNADKGTEIILVPDNKKNQLRIFPVTKEKTAKLRFLLSDLPGSLANVAKMLAKYKVNILASKSRTMVKEETAEWETVVDLSKCNKNIKKIKEKLLKSKFVQDMEIVRK